MNNIISCNKKVNIFNRITKTSANIVIAVIAVVLFSGIVSAANMTYYWTPSSGAIGSSGFTADWGSCNSQPTSYRVTALSSTGFTCNSDRLTTTSTGDQYLAIFPTAYSSDTRITGKTGATFYLSSQRSGYAATYRFDLGYAHGGAFTSLGYVTQAVSSSSGSSYTINMSSISGTAPSGSYPALKVSVTSSRGGRVYLGTNGGTSGSNSGRFYVNETAVTPTPTPTAPTSTPTPTPTSTSTPTPSSTGGQIKLGTNRYVILDDDRSGTLESGFANPASSWSGNEISGKSTTIGAYALFLNNGLPVPGQTITFTFYKPASYGVYQTKTAVTDASGIARAFSDLDNTFFYGRWKVKAESGASSDTSGFIYNWWGCNYNDGNPECDKDHDSDKWRETSSTTANSPYLFGRDRIVGDKDDHMISGVCVGCHRSYDGTPGTANNDYPSTPSTIKTGIHTNIRCDNPSCHNSISTHKNNAVIGSCYGGSGCHSFRTDVSGKSTLNGVVSAYSNTTTGTFDKYHTQGSTVPCIICHGPAHNTTKPDASQQFIKNTVTENSHCWSCHTKREIVHYGENCVSCHSQDAHKIAAGGGPDCISCHDNTGSAIHRVDVSSINSGIHANLNNAAIVGTGIPAANKKCWGCHQSDGKQPTGMGDKYKNPYRCLDCHGNASKPPHASSALSATEHYKNGTDIKAVIFAVNDLASCLFCHNKTEMKVSYTEVDNLWNNVSLVSHYGKKRTDLIDANGTKCAYCHVKPAQVNFTDTFVDINNMNITHNGGNPCSDCHGKGRLHDASLVGGGGPDCRSCHDIGKSGVIRHIDFTAAGQGEHKDMNINLDPVNGPCWACHQTGGIEPSGMGDRAYTPYVCTDCHLAGGIVSGIYHAPIASEHFKNGSDIKAVTGEPTNVLSCVKCHQKTQMIVPNNDNDFGTYDSDNNGIYGGPTNPYVYGMKRPDMRIRSNETNCAYCHQNTSEFNDVFLKLTNAQITHNGGKNCYDCHREKSSFDGKIHDSSLIGGGGGSCTQCHSQAGGAPVVGSNDLGGHINLNTTDGGSNSLTDSDCMTCHYENPHGGPNHANTHYCADCHTSIGTGPKKSTLIFTEKQHGQAECIDCHIADGKYHQGNPRGSVANIVYVNRYSTANIYTDCADCHYAANLDDAPFNAPGGGPHIGSFGGICAGGCHNPGPAKTYIQAKHNTSVVDNGDKPVISLPILNANTVSRGTNVTVTATVTINDGLTATAWVDGAKYRILSGSSVVVPWTPMSANDGNFNSLTEVASAVINTNTLTGAYTVEVRGIGGGPAQNPFIQYYPMNGDVSETRTASLTVT